MGTLDHELLEQLSRALDAAETEQIRAERIRELPDPALIEAQRILGDIRSMHDTVWLPLIEEEMRRRGLISLQ